VKSLREEFGNAVELHGAAAGMHLTITFPRGLKDRDLAAKAVRERLWLLALSPSYMGEKVREGFILGFGSTPAEQIPRAVSRMKALVTG
jgi:GntR family transcriptional regulator/MocR family aminotransferase